jgi:hypothetical protein
VELRISGEWVKGGAEVVAKLVNASSRVLAATETIKVWPEGTRGSTHHTHTFTTNPTTFVPTCHVMRTRSVEELVERWFSP